MEIKTRQFKELAAKWMKDPAAAAFLRKGPYIMPPSGRTPSTTFPDIPEAQAYGAVIRAEAIARLPELLEEFEKNATANGAKVIWVRDTKESNETIVKLIKERGAPYVTKGKSMVTEESGLNEVLDRKRDRALRNRPGRVHRPAAEAPPFPHRRPGHQCSRTGGLRHLHGKGRHEGMHHRPVPSATRPVFSCGKNSTTSRSASPG